MLRARSTGETVSRERWAEAMEGSYPGVARQGAREWWDGAPRDKDRYGTILVHAWPRAGAEHREGGDRRTFGRRPLGAEVVAGEDGRRAQVERWSVGGAGELLVDGREAGDGEADSVPCVRLLLKATRPRSERRLRQRWTMLERLRSEMLGSGPCTLEPRGTSWRNGRSCTRNTTFKWRPRPMAGGSVVRRAVQTDGVCSGVP